MPQPAPFSLHETPLSSALASGALRGFGQPSATCQVTVLARPPAELEAFTSVIGAEATFRLIETSGGLRIYIPKRPNQGTLLARQIGLRAARQLAEEFGGEELKVPVARPWRVATYAINGLSARAIALRLCVCEETVLGLLRGMRMNASRRSASHGA